MRHGWYCPYCGNKLKVLAEFTTCEETVTVSGYIETICKKCKVHVSMTLDDIFKRD